jgi:alkylhydroperoxidase/carboxymuconolactone decarboxylase family protein YurZ
VLINVVGDMYVPKNIDTSKKHAAIVVGHPFGGVTRTQAAEAVTHLAFYAGWSRAMSALSVVKTVFAQHH